MSKSTAQQIADLQNKLQALRTKKARQDRREETRQKIILGAEVAKVLNSKPEEVNKALILHGSEWIYCNNGNRKP